MKISGAVTTYFWKHLECELCKQAYPYETKSLDGKSLLNIIEYDTPQAEPGRDIYYIVLESISSNTSKVIHVINMQNMVKLYIGRGHEAHVRVTDISVSRLHAFLVKSTQGYYFLTDNESKFGTLSLVKTPQILKPNSTNVLQIGRTLFYIEIKQNYQSVLQNCLCLSTKRKKDFNNDLMLTVNGLQSFPSQFATTEYIELMFKRRITSIRKQTGIKNK